MRATKGLLLTGVPFTAAGLAGTRARQVTLGSMEAHTALALAVLLTTHAVLTVGVTVVFTVITVVGGFTGEASTCSLQRSRGNGYVLQGSELKTILEYIYIFLKQEQLHCCHCW